MNKKSKTSFDKLFIEVTCSVREWDQKTTCYLAREEKTFIFIKMTVASLCNFWAHRRYACDAKDLALFIDSSHSSKKTVKKNTCDALFPLPPDSLFEDLKDRLKKNVLVIQIKRPTIVKELSGSKNDANNAPHDEDVVVFSDGSTYIAHRWFKNAALRGESSDENFIHALRDAHRDDNSAILPDGSDCAVSRLSHLE